VPKLGPRAVKRQPTPTNESIKNGPEIVNFRPVLYLGRPEQTAAFIEFDPMIA
jgi:hypothetical protein